MKDRHPGSWGGEELPPRCAARGPGCGRTFPPGWGRSGPAGGEEPAGPEAEVDNMFDLLQTSRGKRKEKNKKANLALTLFPRAPRLAGLGRTRGGSPRAPLPLPPPCWEEGAGPGGKGHGGRGSGDLKLRGMITEDRRAAPGRAPPAPFPSSPGHPCPRPDAPGTCSSSPQRSNPPAQPRGGGGPGPCSLGCTGQGGSWGDQPPAGAPHSFPDWGVGGESSPVSPARPCRSRRSWGCARKLQTAPTARTPRAIGAQGTGAPPGQAPPPCACSSECAGLRPAFSWLIIIVVTLVV